MYFAPFIVFAAMMILTYGAWRSSVTTLHNDIQVAANERTSRIQDSIAQRFAAYEQVITGGAGLIRGSQDVTKNEWHDYVSTFNIAQYYSGLQGIGYIKIFTSEQLSGVISYMQAQGVSDFHVVPDNPRDTYTGVLYTEPPETAGAVGLDMFTQPDRMKTMIRARDTGSTSLTPLVKSLRNNTDQPVLMLFVPQYQRELPLHTTAQRQQAIQGYTYAGVRTGDFFDYIASINKTDGDTIAKITSQTSTEPPRAIYESSQFSKFNNASNYYFKEQTMDIYGQKWTLRYGYKISGLIRPQRRLTPMLTALAGFLFAFLLAEVIFLLLKARARELSSLQNQAVDLAKDELLSLASHQLRTPATTVKQYLGMVLQGFAGDITATQQSLLNKAYIGNERQLYIINEMLHIAKIDAGRIVLARHKTDIVKLVRDVLFEAENDIENAQHKLKETLPSKPLYMRIDAHMLRMAIENLVSNAIKYTPRGGKIHVTVRKGKSLVQIIVKDSGIGIDQKDFSKLYELFTRLDDKRMQNVSGTGVGLYLAKHLVLLHKGDLTVESKPGKGSTFTITLPYIIKRSKHL